MISVKKKSRSAVLKPAKSEHIYSNRGDIGRSENGWGTLHSGRQILGPDRAQLIQVWAYCYSLTQGMPQQSPLESSEMYS